ncbi:MAG: glutamyl-tRNA synthetase [Candidatus Atribacteria bacterium]|nr:glutamyl-tRNA synthetase [Candidatus Atribacteria bacterium]
MENQTRVRFAPSPTGFLHLGGARTALFNWLFARKYGGTFVLRIEDTDLERSDQKSVEVILEGLKWLNLLWDEGPEVGGKYGPYFQSKRLHLYPQFIQKLLVEGKAYYCFCSPEELAERREKTIAQGKSWRYDRRCLFMEQKEKEQLIAEGKKRVVRFRIPEGVTSFVDLLRGEVSFANQELDDFIILRSDDMPTYNFACVIDDALMKISHVIRGDDHISNTPRQVLLYQALGFPLPAFAHIPMILGKDKTRLSKRHGSPSVTYYRDQGYLPEAMMNYLARLGWASGEEEKEIFSEEELIERFDLSNVTKHAAVFDLDKLNWMNGVYIRQRDNASLSRILVEILQKRGKITPSEVTPEMEGYCEQIVAIMKDRMKYLAQIVEEAAYFFEQEVQFDPEAFQKILMKEGTEEILSRCLEEFKEIDDFTAPRLEEVVRKQAENLGIKAAKLIHPLRVAVSGKRVGPGLFELLEVLGKKRVIERIGLALEEISRQRLTQSSSG